MFEKRYTTNYNIRILSVNSLVSNFLISPYQILYTGAILAYLYAICVF